MAINFDPKNLTKEQLNAALACKTPEELVALAKENGVDLTLEKAKECLEQMSSIDMALSDDDMTAVAGGFGCTEECLYDKW